MNRFVLSCILVGVLSLVGCGSTAPSSAPSSDAGGATDGGGPGVIVQDAKDNASIVTCRTNRAQIGQQYSMAQSAGTGVADFASVLEQSGAKCPSGGAYSWDGAAGKARCSVHGE